MNYYIDIIDTADDTHTTILESASKNSIVLDYKGKDSLHELKVVGSALSFNMSVESSNNNDAVFLHLFTGNEQRYKIELKRETDDLLIWHGFLLPDSYSEPYSGSSYFVEFQAVDGLNRLKGKYLPDDFYKDEKSVVEIISKCLELTGLEMELVFAPGVDNRLEKRWDKIYINTENFVEKNKKLNAFKILETFCNDTVSCVYQHLNKWYFEGLNKRNLISYEAKKYSYQAEFLSDFTVTKQVKNLNNKFLSDPLVTMMPPFNEILLSYEGSTVSFPETIAEESNDGWVVLDGTAGEIYSTDWFSNNGFFAKAKHPNYKVFFVSNNNATFDSSKYVELNKKLYVLEGQKLNIKAEFEIEVSGNPGFEGIEDLVQDGTWNNPIKYDILIAGNIIYSNNSGDISLSERLKFDTDKKASLDFEFIPQTSGLLDIRIYQPHGLSSENGIAGIYLNDLTIDEIGFDEDKFISDIANADYTIDVEIDLTYTDNAAGVGTVFQLAKLNVNNEQIFNTIQAPILYGVTYSGINYAVVDLDHANLISDNIDSVFLDDVLLEGLEVVYNFEGGEQMMVKTESLLTGDNEFTVKAFKKIDHDLDRSHWQEWTDSVYVLERKRYAESVVGIYRRLFNNPRPKIDGDVSKAGILFGDMISFDYIEPKTFSLTNTKINFDSGTSSIIMFESSYVQEETNIVPFVDAGPDRFLNTIDQALTIDATAFDPDGVIDTYLWEQVPALTDAIIQNGDQEDVFITGLQGNDYTFRLTVTDDDGNSAFDEVRVLRIVNHTPSFTLLDSTETTTGTLTLRSYVHRLNVAPNLPDNVFIQFNVLIILSISQDVIGLTEARVSVYKNNSIIFSFFISEADETENFDITVLYSQSDIIEVFVYALAESELQQDVQVVARFRIVSATIVNYPGIVLGLPVQVGAFAEVT